MTVNTVEGRRKRQENMVQIRKCRREETLVKKRREGVPSAHNTQPFGGYDQTTSLRGKGEFSYSNLLLLH